MAITTLTVRSAVISSKITAATALVLSLPVLALSVTMSLLSMSTLAAMQVPVQVQCGQNDQLCPPQRQAEMVFVRSGCSLVRVPDCGHFLPIEAERSSIISMEKWLDCVRNGIPEQAA